MLKLLKSLLMVVYMLIRRGAMQMRNLLYNCTFEASFWRPIIIHKHFTSLLHIDSIRDNEGLIREYNAATRLNLIRLDWFFKKRFIIIIPYVYLFIYLK